MKFISRRAFSQKVKCDGCFARQDRGSSLDPFGPFITVEHLNMLVQSMDFKYKPLLQKAVGNIAPPPPPPTIQEDKRICERRGENVDFIDINRLSSQDLRRLGFRHYFHSITVDEPF